MTSSSRSALVTIQFPSGTNPFPTAMGILSILSTTSLFHWENTSKIMILMMNAYPSENPSSNLEPTHLLLPVLQKAETRDEVVSDKFGH